DARDGEHRAWGAGRGEADHAVGSDDESDCRTVNLDAGRGGAGHHAMAHAADPARLSALGNFGGDGSAGRPTTPQAGDRETVDSAQARCVRGLSVRHFYKQVTEKDEVRSTNGGG